MVQRIIADALLKIQGNQKNYKCYLFSGHEYNIAHVLGALQIFKPHIPPYAAYILIELHQIDTTYGFKVRIKHNIYTSP